LNFNLSASPLINRLPSSDSTFYISCRYHKDKVRFYQFSRALQEVYC
jgi:hypothetical protein